MPLRRSTMLFSRRPHPAHPSDELARRFLRWSFARSALWRGYWLLTSVYLVVVAELSAPQLVFIGAAQSTTVVLTELPAGIVSDLRSRRASLVVSHLATGGGMVFAGLTTSFPLLVASQAVCGFGWAFASGADVAWISDELDDRRSVPRVLAARARWDVIGAAGGLLVFGAIATLTELRVGIVVSGLLTIALTGAVGRFPEHRRAHDDRHRMRAGFKLFRDAVGAASRDREIRAVTVAWLLINGSADAYGRLVDTRLIELGFGGTSHPIVWFTAFGLVRLGASALAIRLVEDRIDDAAVARHAIVAACLLGLVGLGAFAVAPDVRVALAGAVLTTGYAHPGTVVRSMTEIWVDRRTHSGVRATTHSLLSIAEQTGEILLGATLAALATLGLRAALAGSAVYLAVAAALVATAGRPPRRR